MADPRVKDLWFEGGTRRFGQRAEDSDDRWWLQYHEGYICTELQVTCTNACTLKDIASMINHSCMTIEDYNNM